MDQHICGFSFLDELESTLTAEAVGRNAPIQLRCGACTKQFQAICLLHEHICSHGNSGSYYYDSFLRTAFPKHGTHCSSTQTSGDIGTNTESTDACVAPVAADNEMVDKSQQTDRVLKTARTFNAKRSRTKTRSQTKSNTVNNFLDAIDVKEDDRNYGIMDDKYESESEMGDPKTVPRYSATKYSDATVREPSYESKSDNSELFTNALYEFDFGTSDKPDYDGESGKQTKSEEHHNLSTKRVSNGNKYNKVKKKRQLGEDFDEEQVIKEKKSERPTMVCEICGKRMQRRDIKVHMRYHTGERPFVCEMCPKAFVSLKKLNYHKKRHSGTKTCQCHVCVASYYTTAELYKHIKEQHSGIVHSCSVCDAAFRSKLGLDLHMRNVHLGEKNFNCDQCDKRFTQKGHLKYHLLQHIGLLYTCPCCSKEFRDRSAMKRHEKTHSNVKPHVCYICKHGSIQKGPYYVHMLRHHGLTKDQVNDYEKQMNEDHG